jgi:hypothetical protein
MIDYTFCFEHADKTQITRVRPLESEGDALSYARQILADWPDCLLVEILRDGAVWDRLRRSYP